MGEKRKKKVIAGFFVFLGMMWLCTVISKSIYASRLPVVTVEEPEGKYVEHIVEAEGIVVAGDKNPVTALSGLRIEQLFIQVGDKVEEGDVLFTIDMEDLDAIIEEKRTAISKVQVQVDTILVNEELARQRKALEEERAREDYDKLAQYEDTLVGRAAEDVNQAEKDVESHAGGSDEELKDALQAAAYAEADAKWNRDNTMKDAERKVEDILLPENEDSSLETYQIELADMQADLALYQEIRNSDGQITAAQGGLITDIYVSAGSRIPDSAVLLLANDSVPCQFKTMLSKEQKSYVGLNDKVTLKLDGSSREIDVTVDYLAESETAPGNYEIYINLPEDTGMPGLSGIMKRTESGEKHSCCISPLALHEEQTRTYVYVVKEREGILGMEYYVEEINVKVIDKNESWVAVEGALDGESQIIVSSTIEVHNGDIVRF
ncbi:MAG: efflux RND transporter periplasmic adaptor subunit [Roseburia sp.]|nr:efflux RND transporter periplasmic adaptor subunit [Roseburia sp.]MCM1242467.1 efflux RND transporter periplasmic adaptor subunit [Roseburia sp.]